jgi:hypothetical protein
MPKVNWKFMREISFQAAISFVLGIVVNDIIKLPEKWKIVWFSIFLYFVLFALVRFTWIRADRFIRQKQLNLKLYELLHPRPRFNYSLGINPEGDLILYIKSHPKNDTANLRLTFNGVRPINANKDWQKAYKSKSREFGGKRIFHKRIDDTRAIELSCIDKNNNRVLCFQDTTQAIHLEPYEYLYEFNEHGFYKKYEFKSRKKSRPFSINKNGEFELND